MQFSVRRDQILELLLDDFNQWLHSFYRPFFLFFSFGDNARRTEVEFVSNNRQYSTVTTIYARPRLHDPRWEIRFHAALLKLSSYRRHRLFFHDQYLQNSGRTAAIEITPRAHTRHRITSLLEKKHTTEAKYSFATFSQIFYFLFVRRVHIFLKYWDRLRGKINCTRMKMMRKLKRDKN